MAKSRILVVDDTPANIKILADLLRKDYLLSVATSEANPLEIAASEDPAGPRTSIVCQGPCAQAINRDCAHFLMLC